MLQTIIDQLRLTWRLLRDQRVPIYLKAIVLAPLVYFISPIDFIPDVLLGVGQLDDLGLFVAGLKVFESLVPAHIVDEHRRAIREGDRGPQVVESSQYRVYSVEDEKPKR